MRIVVTGGAGFIGSHVVDGLLVAGHEVLVVDDLSTGSTRNLPAEVRLVQADIRSDTAAGEVRAFRPEVLNLHAAQIDVRKSVQNPRLDSAINIDGTINIMEAARAGGQLKRVIYAASGGAMYGSAAPIPTPESSPAAPEAFYGVSKFTAELYLRTFQSLYGVPHVALRYSNVYGPRQNIHGEAGVVAIFTERLLRGDACTIFGDGKQTRDYVYVGDVAEANQAALTTAFTGGVNIATGVATDVNELFRILAAQTRTTATAAHAAARPGEQQQSVLSVALAKTALGWAPRTSLAQGIGSTVAWYRAARS